MAPTTTVTGTCSTTCYTAEGCGVDTTTTIVSTTTIESVPTLTGQPDPDYSDTPEDQALVYADMMSWLSEEDAAATYTTPTTSSLASCPTTNAVLCEVSSVLKCCKNCVHAHAPGVECNSGEFVTHCPLADDGGTACCAGCIVALLPVPSLR